VSTLRIDNGLLVTLDDQRRCIEGGSLLIENGTIVELGDGVGGDTRPDHVIDARGKVVMPGLINAHHHLYSTFARGYAPPGAAPENFKEILEGLWWKLDKALEPDDVYDSAVLALIEGAHAGCTTVIDHHASPSCCDGSLDAIERAFRDTGLSGCLCYEVSDRNAEGQGIEENLRFIDKCRASGDDQLGALFGLHALMTLGEATLERCEAIAKEHGVGFHVHVAEDAIDVRLAQERHGRHIMEVFAEHGIAGPQSIFVHGVHLDPAELDILAATNSIAVNCPESNMNNAVGVADVPAMLDRGILAGLGTDGMSSNLLSQARAMYLQQRLTRRDPATGFVEACRMLLENNREICDRLFREPRGVLAPGALGDVIVYDYVPPTPLNSETLYGHLLFGLAHARVHTTIARGEVVVDAGHFMPLDEAAFRVRCAERAPAIWRRAAS
jgi:putative selenium metabolism protein SsnA